MATILYGTVGKDGTKLGGDGYTVNHTKGTGLYYITFSKPFNRMPGASATQIYPNDKSSDGGDTTDNAVLVYLSADQMIVKTGDNEGDADDRDFSFVLAGD